VITLRDLLEQMVAKKASDLHITAGVPPEFRIDGAIIPADMAALTPETTAALAALCGITLASRDGRVLAEALNNSSARPVAPRPVRAATPKQP
jgi:Tfp pilus assembly ATPase PilU